MATNHISDLIYLFLDGEATETEREVLFDALKDSPGLQEEFSSAVQAKNAFAADLEQLQPPAFLQQQIAQKAGLMAAKAAASATAVSGTTTAIATTVILKTALLIALGTSVGIMATLGVQRFTAGGQQPVAVATQANTTVTSSPATLAAPVIEAGTPLQASSAPATSDNAAPTGNSSFAQEGAKPFVSKNRESSATFSSLQRSSSVGSSISDRSLAHKTIVQVPSASSQETSTIATVDHQQLNDIPADANVDRAAMEWKSIASAEIKGLVPLGVRTEGKQQPMHLSELRSGYPLDEGLFSRLSLELRSIATMAQLPNREVSNGSTAGLTQLGVSVGYDLNRDESIGIEAAREIYPIYLTTTSGDLAPYRSIYWGGLYYKMIFSEVELPLGIHPFAKGTAGLGNPGPIGKGSVGLYWETSEMLSFATSLDGLAVFFKSNGATSVGGKVGGSLSAIVHF